MKNWSLILVFLIPFHVFGQEVNSSLTEENLLPLGVLIETAISNAPLISRLSKGQEQRQEEIKIAKKSWTQHIALTGGYNYGNVVVADRLTTPQDISTVFRTNTSSTYYVGAALRLPLSELSTRKNQIKIQELAIEEMEFQKLDIEQTIQQEVTKRYNELLKSLTTIRLQAKKVEADETAVQITEQHFRNGTATMDEYRMALDILNTAKIELEKTKRDAWFYMQTLEQFVGSSIFKKS
ncbi:TolC family protein [Algoriphagus limi]|uniref:TolC family protein n=1 Tax=Algoriphagus limi TaxID=2975273 RepID=A0ABT2GAQ6_9BACT|nr:TolC family protein [Algoriphagus limi]MCS5491095.1 TolC family protein [Algoriphagus limi]